MKDGYIMIHRKIFDDWEWTKDAIVFELFVYLIAKAGWKDESHILKRGQLATSIEELSEVLGVSVRSIQYDLTKLEKSDNIHVQRTAGKKGGLIITVRNYSKWQCKAQDDEPAIELPIPQPIPQPPIQPASKQAQDVGRWLEHLVETNQYGQYVEAAWLEITAMKNGFESLDDLIDELNRRDAGSFYAHCIAQGKDIKTLQDTKAHFNNSYKLLKDASNQRNTDGSYSHYSAAERRRAEYEKVGRELMQSYGIVDT